MLGSSVGNTTSLGTTAPSTGMPSLPTAAGPLHVGQSFGPRYHIIKLLGAGGMGAVYQAWDSELNVAVAVKVIRADRRRGSASSEAERRFKNELLLARQVTHKNVVRIHDLGEIDGSTERAGGNPSVTRRFIASMRSCGLADAVLRTPVNISYRISPNA